MNKKRAFKNILTSTIFKALIVFFTIFSRSYLMRYAGEEATGLYSLYVSVLGILSIVDLGVGTAITFSMYKPLVENDNKTVSSLFYLYKKIYFILFFVLTIIGLGIVPFLPYLAKDNSGNINITVTYLIFLMSQLVNYFYAHKISYINAKMDNYISTIIHSTSQILIAILQIFILISFKSLTLYLLSILIGNLLQLVTTEIVFKLKYSKDIVNYKSIDKELKDDIVKRIKAMFMHKIGGLLVSAFDGVIISAFISVTILGIYSNYTSIVTGMISVLSLIFTSITSIIGQSFAKYSKDKYFMNFKKVYIVNYLLAFVFFFGFHAVINPLISIIFTDDSLLPKDVILFITINYFIQFMRNATLTFKDAAGLFYQDRFKPIVEGVINIVLSLALVSFFGIKGVLISTILTNLFVTQIIEPIVLFKYGFGRKPSKFILINYLLIILFVIYQIIIFFSPIPLIENNYLAIFIYGTASVLISLITFAVLTLLVKPVRVILLNLLRR